jgi:hypothetical protein
MTQTFQSGYDGRKEKKKLAEYATVVGFVQFPVTDRQLDSGETVFDVTVRPAGVDAPLVRITIWPELAEALEAEGVQVEEGDFVAFDGQYSERTGQKQDGGKTTYRNVNAKKVTVSKGITAAPREVVNKSTSKRSF